MILMVIMVTIIFCFIFITLIMVSCCWFRPAIGAMFGADGAS